MNCGADELGSKYVSGPCLCVHIHLVLAVGKDENKDGREEGGSEGRYRRDRLRERGKERELREGTEGEK